MFRVTSEVCKVRCLLHRNNIAELTIASLQRHAAKHIKSQEREICPKEKVPPPPPKNDNMFWGAMAMLTLAGGFAVYAKLNPEVRDWLTVHAPWFDDIIAVAYQENMSYTDIAMSCMEDAKKRMIRYFEGPRECIIEDIEEISNDEEDDLPCKMLPEPVITKDICEIEACMKDLGESIINNYMTARDASRYYNKLTTETLNKFSLAGLKALRDAMVERRDLVLTSVANAEADQARLNDLIHFLECGAVTAPKEKLNTTREMLKEYQDRITIIGIEYQYENDKAGALDVQWIKLEGLLDTYMGEIKAVYPELDYLDQKPKIEGDPEFLLYHTLRYVQSLQMKLYDTLDTMTLKVDHGLEMLPQDEKHLQNRNKEISSLYKQKLKELEKGSSPAAQTKEINQDVALMTKELLKQMQRNHEASILQRTAEEEKRIMMSYDTMVPERVKAKTEHFAKQIREISMKMDVVNRRIKSSSMAAEETKRSQDLWAAAASILAATKRGEHSVNVTKELKAMKMASGTDKLVTTVLNAIPKSVWDNGIVPESVLREKYHSMETVALQVALVEQGGAPLPLYAFSFLQYLFLIMKPMSIPQHELDDPPKELLKEKYDTFDLLQRARYFINQGNIPAAVKYVGALEGASRGAAATWYEAARAHLETRQAAETVIAHAVAMGLKYV